MLDISQRRAKRQWMREYARRRRQILSAQKLCLNGAKHGPATDGGLCKKCRLQHRL